jgi:iron complex outermembrane receptor protein
LQDEILIRSDLTAYVGIRGDLWETFDGYANQFGTGTGAFSKSYEPRDAGALSPKLAFVYKPFAKTTLRTSAGQAFRGPTVYELYRTWVSTSGVTYNANPDLKPETVRSWDIGVTQGLWIGAKISAAYFENYMTDLIYRKSVSTTQQDYVNAGEGESKGTTVELEQRIGTWLRLFGNLTYTDARIKKNGASPLSEGKRITFMPDIMFNMGAVAEKGPFTFSLTSRYVGKRYSDDQNRDEVNNVYTSYDPFVTADAKVSYQIARFAKLSVAVNNLAGETHFEYYKAPGRSFFGEVELKFD